MDAIEKLTELFTHFPGIGPRQARRFAYHILSQTNESYDGLISSMQQVRKDVVRCPQCYVYFTKKYTENLCPQCRDTSRTRQTLLVVEKDVDLHAIEKSRTYNGLYFVLGGVMQIHEDKPSQRLRIHDLIRSIRNQMQSGLSEVIIALSANQEGDHTFLYLQKLLNETIPGIRVSMLGRGLSNGTEIEYIDPTTFTQAFSNRK